MKSDPTKLARVSIACILMVVGVLIAVFHDVIYWVFESTLPIMERVAIRNTFNRYFAIPLGIGVAIFLIGVFKLLFSGPAWGALSRRLLSFLPSSKLLGSLFLFLLPWVNVQCHYRQHDDRRQYNSVPANDLVVYQTGLQAGYGGYTTMPILLQRGANAFSKPPQPALLVDTAGLVLLAGVAGGLLLRRRLARFAVLPVCALVAFLLLFLQSQRELPISVAVAEANRETLRDPQFAVQHSQVRGPPQLVLERTWWFYAALALPLAAVLAAGGDWLVQRKKAAIQFQETLVLLGLAALGSLALPIAMHAFSSQPSSSQSDANTQEPGTAAQEAAGGTTQTLPREIAVDLGKGVKLEMVLIPAGEFLMGSPDSDEAALAYEKPQHRVRITKPFYLGKYLVTQEQWEAVMGDNPNNMNKGAKFPMMYVNWDDCRQFAEKLNAKSAAGGGKFQLPTQAQWEYACRAGSTTQYYFGDDASRLGEYAWNQGGGHNTVGQKKPNAWGLYDMYGFVWQWCQDWYDGGYYAESPTDDPPGPAAGSAHVFRGGCCEYNYTWDCRSASYFAHADRPGDFRYTRLMQLCVGLRVCLVPAEK